VIDRRKAGWPCAGGATLLARRPCDSQSRRTQPSTGQRCGGTDCSDSGTPKLPMSPLQLPLRSSAPGSPVEGVCAPAVAAASSAAARAKRRIVEEEAAVITFSIVV